ncbi:FAD-dependent oxidoreductase [Thalassotalea sp. PLHSN55]|uniref:FAD-dependent oxidoreductase n=1 Tax=Thalassotalea sp. PLHSN55 TaxID=3435888 RepID=UPI003F8789BD
MNAVTKSEVLIIGAGLAGICAALELLNAGKSVTMVDANPKEKFGGLANNAFGGMLLNQTAEQKRLFVNDSPELMLNDWLRAAEFSKQHVWQKAWAKAYVERSNEEVYLWLKSLGISFFPIVHWVERGDFQPGNSVPRYHVAWGCGQGVVQTLIDKLQHHQYAKNLTLYFDHRVNELTKTNNHITGCSGTNIGGEFQFQAEHTVVACGGINGNLARVRQEWDPVYGTPPNNMLNGSDPICDGRLHDQVDEVGGKVTNLKWMWNYAAGIAKPNAQFDNEGLALIPPRSALWLDCYGRRVGPDPMMGAFDTHRLCKRMGHLDHQYGWIVLNWHVAIREMAISGSDMNVNFRDKKFLKVLLGVIQGSGKQVQWMIDECPDVVSAPTLELLARKMDDVVGCQRINIHGMRADIEKYDQLIVKGKTYYADDQLRRISQAKRWIGDYVRTASFRPILDKKSLPLIAIRLRFLSRKSMGGIETNLSCKVLDKNNKTINGLYAIGEAAGFGGGGICGKRSLEGTFLSNCIFNGRIVADTIIQGA